MASAPAEETHENIQMGAATMATAGAPVLIPRTLLGLRTHIKGNVQYLSEEEVCYPVGGVLAIHNITQKKQKFIKLNERGANVNLICVSSNRKLVAISEEGEKPSITIYDPWSFKKKKQIFFPVEKELTATTVVAMAFTYDSKNLIAILGEPDWWMFVFKAEKGRLEHMARANNSNNTGTVVQVCPNPSDPHLLVLIGSALYRNLALSENTWRQFGFTKAENLNFISGCWITQDRLLAGTDNGKILFFENSDLKRIFSAIDLQVMVLKVFDEMAHDTLTLATITTSAANESIGDAYGLGIGQEGFEVTHLTAFNKGFMFSHTKGTIYYFEKATQHKYVLRTVFKVPDNNTVRSEEEFPEEFLPYKTQNFNEVNSVSVCPSEDRFLITCQETQIYTAKLFGSEAEVTMTEFGLPLHHGPIACVSVCSWKPILMTTGLWDRTLRVWNYETETLELIKKYSEDLLGCDLQPTGFFAVVGFSDKLRMLKLMIDDFVCNREYPIRNCKLVKFSKLGHLFAAANGNVIQVYSTVTFEHMFNLKGHNGIVTGLSWVHDDYKISTCGNEGAVYEWQISTTRRICETIIKTCQFSGICVTNDGKSNFCVGSDGLVREIVNSNVYGELQVSPNHLDCMCLANSDAMMFASGHKGVVYSMTIPFSDAPSINEYTVHADTVISMQITYDDRHIITVSAGCICVWKIVGASTRMVRIDKEFMVSTEVMIERNDLLDKISLIKDLQVRMNELQTEHAYQMRQSEAAHAAIVKEIHETYLATIEELKEKNENLEQEHNQEISNINVEINKMKNQHDLFVQKLEANYNEKLIVEYDKFILLEEKMSRMRNTYDKQLEELAEGKKLSEESITNRFVIKLQEKDVQLEELQEQIKMMAKDSEMIKLHIEDDADREIYEMKTQFEKELHEEQDLNVKLRGETQSSKKKLQQSQKNIDDMMHTLHTHEIEQHKLKAVIFGLEQSIGDLRKEIIERDMTIQDKEKRIAELKHKNQELEKFKFILEFKIDELKAQIEPRDRTIREQTEQINDMVNELENLQKIIQSLELQLNELREKLKAADNETKREIVKNRAAMASLKRIKTEIHNASGLAHDVPKLQKAVREMYRKHNMDKDFTVAHAEDTEAKKEFLRQRDFLERSVKALKSQVAKAKSHTGENLRLVEQNSQLIAETNNLRKNLKNERKDNKRITALLGFKANLTTSKKNLDVALATGEEIRHEFETVIEQEGKELAFLQDQNARLRDRVGELLESNARKGDNN